jgi:tRNA threonylcarbamoyl adenosine modification protein YeaZ
VLVLVLDTSSAAVTAALCDVAEGVDVLAAGQIVNARGHGENLAPLIARCLDDRTPDELGAIVAGVGPGPYTGLRVGLVTAAVMSDTLGIPTYGVCSLDGIGAGEDGLLVAADARRREVYWATYRNGARADGPDVARAADVPRDGLTAMAGAGARLYADVLGLPLQDRDFPEPGRLAECARDRITTHAPSEQLRPLYLRRPDATIPAAPKQVSQ